jgi:hypothetical protein
MIAEFECRGFSPPAVQVDDMEGIHERALIKYLMDNSTNDHKWSQEKYAE